MKVGDLIQTMANSNQNVVMVEPVDRIVCGAKPGNFVVVSFDDIKKVEEVFNLYVLEIKAYNDRIWIKV